jgi:hypothetical protein
MRYLLNSTETADTLLEKMVQSAFQVVEGSVPESRQEDIQMGFYVALRRVLSQNVIRCDECGRFAECSDLKEVPAFSGSSPQGAAPRV